MNYVSTYSSLKPLECCEFKNLDRQIGVMVSEPFTHRGFTPPRRCVEVNYETICVNTKSFCSCGVDAENWKPLVKQDTETILRELEEVIKELTSHRDRLKVELSNL